MSLSLEELKRTVALLLGPEEGSRINSLWDERDALTASRNLLQAQLAEKQTQLDAKQVQVQKLKEDKDVLQLKVDELQIKVTEWKVLAAAPEDPSLSAMMQKIGNLKERLREAVDVKDATAEELAAYRSDAEREIAQKNAQLAALSAEFKRTELSARVLHLSALLDERCDKLRGHV